MVINTVIHYLHAVFKQCYSMAAKRSFFGDHDTPAVKRWENFKHFYNNEIVNEVV